MSQTNSPKKEPMAEVRMPSPPPMQIVTDGIWKDKVTFLTTEEVKAELLKS